MKGNPVSVRKLDWNRVSNESSLPRGSLPQVEHEFAIGDGISFRAPNHALQVVDSHCGTIQQKMTVLVDIEQDKTVSFDRGEVILLSRLCRDFGRFA